MKYDDKYKRVNDEWKNGGMFKGKEDCECSICGESTKWIEPSFTLPVCSDECYNLMCQEYQKYMLMGAGVKV